MKRISLIIGLICLGGITLAQVNENLQDGYHEFKYPNGTVSSEGYLKNGKPEGLWKSYYVTGIKKSEGIRRNFLLDSIWVFYDQTGDTLEKINYLYGKRNGWYFRYKRDPGTGLYLWSQELYAGDIKEGTAYFYFPDGRIQQTITYSQGKKEGLSKEYDRNGNIISLLEYNKDYLISRQRINRTDQEGLKQGEWKDFYDNGAIMTEKSYRNDQLHGYYKEYDTRGRLVITMLYDNGSIVKSRVEDEPDIEVDNRHDANGKLIYSGPFRIDVPVGIHREYGPDGKVTNSFIYNDMGLLLSEGIIDEAGNRNGKWKDFFENGSVRAEGQYTDNRRSGIWKFNNPAGKVEQTGSFNNDRPDGLWKWYYETGTLLREEEYFQGQRDGSFIEYSPDGEVISRGQYTDGEKNGDWKYNAGDNTEEGKYIIGLRDGLWRSYYPDGTLRFKGNYIQGNSDGTHSYYYDDGKLREAQYFRNGIREKTWKKYDELGNQILTIGYRNDVEVNINGIKINLPESDIKLIK